MAISWYFVRLPGFFQEIATAFGLAMTVVVGRWCEFAGVRRLLRCVLRNAGDGVPYGQKCRATPPGVAVSAPLRVGATLAVVPSPTIHGGGGRKPTALQWQQFHSRKITERLERRATPPGVAASAP